MHDAEYVDAGAFGVEGRLLPKGNASLAAAAKNAAVYRQLPQIDPAL